MNDETKPHTRWPAKRIAALFLTLLLALLALYAWKTGDSENHEMLLLCAGIVLGLIYVVRGGRLPPIIHQMSRSHWIGGTGINEDDDPQNLPPILYLSILFAAVVIAAAVFFFFGRAR